MEEKINIEILKEKFGFPLIYVPEENLKESDYYMDEFLNEMMVLSEEKTLEIYNEFVLKNYESLSLIMADLNRKLYGLFDENFELEKDERPGINFLRDKDFINSISLEKLLELERWSHNGKIQLEIGIRYFEGKSYDEAFKWLSKADKALESGARYYLGIMYDLGLGVLQDVKKARSYYEPISCCELEKVSNIIGGFYFEEVGFPEDLPETISETIAAAENGNVYAQFKLAYLYQNGYGLEADKSKAFQWYKKAADAGLLEAKEELEKINLYC